MRPPDPERAAAPGRGTEGGADVTGEATTGSLLAERKHRRPSREEAHVRLIRWSAEAAHAARVVRTRTVTS